MPLKNEILVSLSKSQGKVVSGSYLAELYGVSRNAVWKAVNALRAEGYMIESVEKKGYMLRPDSDFLSGEIIRSLLPVKYSDMKIFTYKSVTSTNDLAKKFSLSSPRENAVFIADSQTAGKGRYGRSYYSPPLTGLYLSAVSHPNKTISSAAVYTSAAAVAVSRAIRTMTGIRPQIKWVNDLYLNGKKICGILTETLTDFETAEVRTMITGIGINITTTDFPDEIVNTASCVGKKISRNELSARIIENLYEILGSDPAHFMDEYRRDSFLDSKRIVFFDGKNEISAKVAGIGNECEIILETENGICAYRHGEIKRIIDN